MGSATLEALESRVSALEEASETASPRVTCRIITELVALHCNVTPAQIVSDQRSRQITYPRFMAIWLATKTTGLSTTVIGRRFGERDHTTVMHARDRFEQLRASHIEWAQRSDVLLGIITGAIK